MIAAENSAKEIFFAALDCVSADEQDFFVATACAGDQELRRRVVALLRAHHESGRFLGGARPDRRVAAPDAEISQVGPYRLIRQLGSGGMGVVWLAEQTSPVRRQVALKLVHPGLGSSRVLARFAAERQALELMDHPHIARVLDAGTTAAGAPYFVMELVEGTSITKYCDDRQLPLNDRLKLFLAVCQAVQHAHQKGIIHRDLKPSNVLVTEVDGASTPKVIDFGIAKAIGQADLAGATFTLTGQIVGTPEYMSPEQAEQGKRDVDTRSDIYSLGVLLYELLTGVTPFRRVPNSANNLSELLRTIREVDPKRPSERITNRVSTETAAEQRGSSQARRLRAVRGDLDWIVLKCLEKSRGRRYQSAGSLADDVRRYLDGMPVEAHQPSRLYRLQKFVVRNRLTVASSLLMLLLLVGGLVGTSLGLRRATVANESQRRLLYCADMNLAMEAWRANDQPRLVELLRRHTPKTGELDLRGFEWFHLWELSQRYHPPAVFLPCKPWSVAFAPNGEQFAVGLTDGTVQVYDLKTLQLISHYGHKLPGHTHRTKVIYTSDGSRLVFQSEYEVVVVELSSGVEVPLSVPRPVRSVAISADDKFLAAGIMGGRVLIWDLLSKNQVSEFEVPAMTVVSSLAFSHEGRTLVVGGDGRAVHVIPDITKPTERFPISGSVTWDTVIEFSRDDKLLASIQERKAYLWKLSDVGKVHELRHDLQVYCLALSPDGRQLLTGTRDGNVHVWDLNRGTLERKLPAHHATVHAMAFSPNGRTLLTVGGDRTVRVWPSSVPVQHDFLQLNMGTQFAHVTSTGRHVVALMARAGRPPRQVRIWRLDTREEIPVEFPGQGSVGQVAVSASDRIAVAVHNAEVLLLNGLGKSYDRLPIKTQDPARISALAFSPDGRLLAVGRDSGDVSLWDLATQKKLLSLASGSGYVQMLQFASDGRVLAAARDNNVILWQHGTGSNAGDWTELKRLESNWSPVLAVEFAPGDDDLIATGNHDGSVNLWRWRTSEPPRVLRGHTEGVFDVAFTKDGTSLVSGGGDLDVVFWDLATGQQRVRLNQNAPLEGPSLAFSPDGQTLISGDWGLRLYFWHAATKAQVAEAGW